MEPLKYFMLSPFTLGCYGKVHTTLLYYWGIPLVSDFFTKHWRNPITL